MGHKPNHRSLIIAVLRLLTALVRWVDELSELLRWFDDDDWPFW